MDTSIALRIDGNARQWGGNNSPQGDRQNRRRQKLPPVATSNSPICGQVKLPQGERQEWMDCYSDWLAFARRLAASLSR